MRFPNLPGSLTLKLNFPKNALISIKKEHIPNNVFTNTKKYNEIVTIVKIQI